MKALKFTLPLVLTATLGGCAVYGPPVVYDQPYPPAPVYAQPVYVAPQPAYVQPGVSFGFSYRSGRRWHRHHY